MSTNAEDFRASFERARGSAVFNNTGTDRSLDEFS